MSTTLEIEQQNKGSPRGYVYCIIFLVAAVIVSLVLAAYYGAKYHQLMNTGNATTSGEEGPPKDLVQLTIIQCNDVYELMPVIQGGGMARLKTLRDEELMENPNLLTVLAGDLISPSPLGTAYFPLNATSSLNGHQMVDVMNMIPLDLATFGNHEFDSSKFTNLGYAISHANWTWLSMNVANSSNGAGFAGVPQYVVKTYQGVRVGFIGVSSYLQPQSKYMTVLNLTGIISTLNTIITNHKAEWDFLVAISHLAMADDETMVDAVPGIGMVIGGHEHENWFFQRGTGMAATPTGLQQITKADANLITVWIHSLTFNTTTKELIELESELEPLNNKVALDPVVQARCQYWVDGAFAYFVLHGINASALVTTLPTQIDARDLTMRSVQSPLGTLIAKSLGIPYPVQMSLINSGTIRTDDFILPGPLTGYDVLRIAPYVDYVWTANMTGALLIYLLDQNLQSFVGQGAYLDYYNITYFNKTWYYAVTNQPINATEWYSVASINYLYTGLQAPLQWLIDGYVSTDGTQRLNVVNNSTNSSLDFRLFMIQELQNEYGVPS